MCKRKVTFINGPYQGEFSETHGSLKDGDIIVTRSYPELHHYPDDVNLRGGLYDMIKSKYLVHGNYAYYLGQQQD